MELQEFIKKFGEAIDVANIEDLSPETDFHELEEWSSLSVMVVIAFFDEVFDKQVGDEEIRQAVTIQDLYKLISV